MSLIITRRRVLALAATALAFGCNEQQLQQGFAEDLTPPVVTITKSGGDTLQLATGIVFEVGAFDNLGVKDVSVTLSVGFDLQFDTTLVAAITSLTLPFNIALPPNTTAGGIIVIDASVTDGNNNTATATDSLFLFNQQALTVRIIDPQPGAVTTPGLSIPLAIEAVQNTGVRRVGYTTTGVVNAADSMSFALPDTAVFDTILTVPGNTAIGEFTIIGFAEDSSGRRANSSPVVVSVQSVLTDSIPPFVRFTVNSRSEVTDSVFVTATDAGGIASIEWLGTDLGGNKLGGDTLTSSGTLTQVSGRFSLDFAFTTFPQLVQIRAFATDVAGNRGEARLDTTITSPTVIDTITVVNGITKPLPAGGVVGDGIYNPNRNEFYITNTLLNRLEVFQLADTSYLPGGIIIGSEPLGIALWPRDTLGNNADTVIIANSGATNLSIVDVANRRETRRHRLPNFLVQSVKTEIDPNNNQIKVNVTTFDFSDRPQFLGVTCRPNSGATACAPDSIYTTYSTTPTPGQTEPFEDRGTVRWENLTSGTPHSHFFWEQAQVTPSPEADSLQVLIDRGPTVPIDTSLSVAKGIMVDLEDLAFQTVTYVRNSGNATHALIGEGGNVDLARAIGYNGNRPIASSRDTTVIVGQQISGPSEVDFGITPGIRVRDFIANTATRVQSIAINFNGLTNLVRADSVYVLDENLRLAGLVPVGGTNAGMDLNFQHAFDPFVRGTGGFGGTADSSLRVVFLARPDANIDVFDTFYFSRVATIPIRDPIIGPLRAALLPTGEQVLVGVTARGVVTVRFPQIPNIFPDPPTGDGGG